MLINVKEKSKAIFRDLQGTFGDKTIVGIELLFVFKALCSECLRTGTGKRITCYPVGRKRM